MTTISDILREATNGQIDETVLTEIESAFNVRLEQKTKLHVEKALMEQDALYTAKLEKLLEAIDADHTTKLNKLVESIDKDRTAKLKAVITKYEKTLNEDAQAFKSQLVETISDYLDVYLEQTIPSVDIQEAVKNKKAVMVLDSLRKHLAIDSALQKESIKNAIVDGKNQINEASTKLESALREKAVLEEELNTLKTNLLIEQKTADLDGRTAKFVKKMLVDKPYDYIEENFDYTVKLFQKQEESRLEGLKKEALRESTKVDHVVEESAPVESENPYLSELRKY